MFCASLDGRRVWGRMDTCVWMAESLHCSPETTTTLIVCYILIQNKKFKVKKKNETEAFGENENLQFTMD